ncbi:MAG: hypothetical protein U0R19_21845 [Bryobacteraceae bacterium]
MVAGVFVARWTVPMALKGTSFIWADLREKPHLIAWAILAGMLWAVANTLTVFEFATSASPSPSVVEYEQPGRVVLGMAPVQQAVERARRNARKCWGAWRPIVIGACVLASRRLMVARPIPVGNRVAGHRRRTRRRCALGHYVYPIARRTSAG